MDGTTKLLILLLVGIAVLALFAIGSVAGKWISTRDADECEDCHTWLHPGNTAITCLAHRLCGDCDTHRQDGCRDCRTERREQVA